MSAFARSSPDFLTSFPAVDDVGLREMHAPSPAPGESVDLSLLTHQLDCCDWRGFRICGHVRRDEYPLGVYECNNGHRWVLVLE